MSTHSKRQGRPVVQRDAQTYLPKVEAHQRLLRLHGTEWDKTRGDEHIAAILFSLRLLLLDELVDRVQAIKRMLFVNTAPTPLPPPGGHFSGVGGLAVMRLGDDESKVIALCEMPGMDQREHPVLPFRRWWEKEQPVQHGTRAYTRRFLIYEAANTDGVHIDDDLDAAYDAILRDVPDWTFSNAKGDQFPVVGVAAASIRQIAWEVDRSLTANLALHAATGPDVSAR